MFDVAKIYYMTNSPMGYAYNVKLLTKGWGERDGYWYAGYGKAFKADEYDKAVIYAEENANEVWYTEDALKN